MIRAGGYAVKTLTSTELKGRLGEAMEQAQIEPVAVSKSGRPYAVIMSQRDYERFLALEDCYWSERASEARKSGFLGPDATMDLLRGGPAEV
jgi:prevent-host-death family protein